MMKSTRIIICLFAATVCLLSVGCGRESRNNRTAELAGYWDGYDYASTDGLSDIGAAEKRFEGYAELLNAVPDSVAAGSVRRFIRDIAANEVALYVYMEWFEVYFHSLGSPYRNNAVFDACLDELLATDALDDYAKLRPAHLKNVSAKNRVGNIAEDFAMRNTLGRDFRLSDLRGQRVLLLFVDAECTSCCAMMDEASDSRKIGKAARKGELQLLAVAAMGRQEAIEQFATDYKENWTVTFCPTDELVDGNKYDMTMTPSFLLLDADGKVEISYDTDISKVEKLL